MNTRIVPGAIVILTIVSFMTEASSQVVPPQDSLAAISDSLIRRIDHETYMIGSVRFNKRTKEASVPGRVNQTEGMIEYLAVTPTGKTHESILTLETQPLHVQTALLLLGANFGGNLRFQGDTAAPAGDTLQIYIAWKAENGDSVVRAASDLVYDATSKKTMPKVGWVFTGSMLNQGRYMADMEGSIIATYSDPVAILNNPLEGRITNGYREQPAYLANKEILPEKGKEIYLIIRR